MEKHNVHVLIGNIPEKLRSADLRAFFSQFIESNGFICFHYRHRPESKLFSSVNATQQDNPESRNSNSLEKESSCESQTVNKDSNDGNDSRQAFNKTNVPNTKCCVTVIEKKNFQNFFRDYQRKIWTDRDGKYFKSRTLISRIKLKDSKEVDQLGAGDVSTKPEHSQLTTDDLARLPELNPPPIMPNGNVGTPLSVLMDLIRTCRFPPRMISKLDLKFPKNRSSRKYGALGYNYSKKKAFDLRNNQFDTTETNSKINDNEELLDDEEINHQYEDKNNDDDHDPDVEEWDRYEAIFDDVDKQGRTKERLFEDEIELKWEKGGSGLVFYTDANYWKEQEGDFDEQTVDDWDVDFSAYYERDGGDKDVRDMIQMRIEKRRREGIEDTSIGTTGGIGEFERHTKGFGGRILQSQGWKKGAGIGRIQDSITEPIETNGQNPRCKTGFGYHGEKLNRNVKRRKADSNRLIPTIYDNLENEPKDTAYRSAGPDTLKYRFVNFVSASEHSQP
ncbi:G patch domain-containing protein 3 [Trichoplax sp. H2]|nr:G patch domain-containing protein 3 [Trichoplax sp. H2]|eukprot:RDD40704.1 G patch domain-containing protein 3 [Trichoplax sp. H2]